MMRGSFPIFYFSGTGNTWWISERIAETLQKLGLRAQAYSIEQIGPERAGELIAEAEGVGLGFPIYGSDAPRVFSAWLRKLPAQKEKKPLLGFVTQWGFSGDGCNFLEDLFNEKGLALTWAAEFNMPNNICFPVTPLFPYQSDTNKFTGLLAKRLKAVEALCARIVSGEGWRQHSGPIWRASGWIQRGPFRLGHDWGRKFWSVEKEKCLGERCGRCARICPVGNIHLVNDTAVHRDACVYCMRCFDYCPTYAIRYMGAANKKLEKKPPYRGPTPGFQPELICAKKT